MHMPLTWMRSATACRSQRPGRGKWHALHSPPAEPHGAWRSTALSPQRWKSQSSSPFCTAHMPTKSGCNRISISQPANTPVLHKTNLH